MASGSLLAGLMAAQQLPALALNIMLSPLPPASLVGPWHEVQVFTGTTAICETEKLKVSIAKENCSLRDSEFASSHNCVPYLSKPQFPHRQQRGDLEDDGNPFSLQFGASVCPDEFNHFVRPGLGPHTQDGICLEGQPAPCSLLACDSSFSDSEAFGYLLFPLSSQL